MKKNLMVLSSFVLSLTPVVAFAQTNSALCATGQLGSWVCKVSQLIAGVLPVLIALAVVYFVWGVISFVIAADEDAKTKGRDKIIYGVIGLAVIVAVWGLVGILQSTFGVSQGVNVTLPGVPDLSRPLPACTGGQTPSSGLCQ